MSGPRHARRTLGPGLGWGLLLLALLGAVAPARAQSALEVLQVGWGGVVVPGTWSPLRVRVTGGAAEATARVEVVLRVQVPPRSPAGSATEYPVAAYGEELALPAGVTKAVTLWLPTDANASGLVRLRAGGAVLAEETVRFESARAPAWPLVGVLADAPAIARQVAQIEPLYQSLPLPLNVAPLQVAELPPLAERLGALSALVVQGQAADGLTAEQRRAVQEWVDGGGHLVLLGGPDAPRAASVLPAGALPVAFGGVEPSADLLPLGGLLPPDPAVSRGPAARFRAEGGTILVGSREQPLAWRTSVGQGSVTLLAVDPALAPFASWPATPLLLQAALAPALPRPGEDESLRMYRQMQRNDAARLQSLVGALPPEAYPDWQTAALLLGGFALLVGPLLHVALWRADRRPWVWWLVPGAALLVTALLFGAGIGLARRDVVTNVVSYVRVEAGGGAARQSLAAGFFAPTHPRLAVTLHGDLPVRASAQADNTMYPGVLPPVGYPLPMRPPGPGGTWSGPVTVAAGEPPYQVIGGRDTRVEYAGDQWSMRALTLERPLADVGAIAAQLQLEGGLIRGTLRNDTPYRLEDTAVVVGQSFTLLGSLAPGQTTSVVVEPATSGASPNVPFQLSQRLFARQGGGVPVGVPVAPRGGMVPMDVPNEPEVQRRWRLASMTIENRASPYGPYGPGPGAQNSGLPLTFIGFTDHAVGGAQPWVGNHPTYHLALVEQPLRFDFAPGSFTLPASLTPARVLPLRAAAPPVIPSPAGGLMYQLSQGEIVFEFSPPLPAKAQPEALTVRTEQAGLPVGRGFGPGPAPPATSTADAGQFSIFNWQSGEFDALPGGQTRVRVEPAAVYVGPERQVRVRVVARPDANSGVHLPELMVEGRVAE